MVPDRGSDRQKASGDSCGGFAHKQDSIVVTLDQAAFGGVVLVPSHGGCSSTECWKDGPLQLG